MADLLQVDITDATSELTDPQTQWIASNALAAGKRLRCTGQVRVRVACGLRGLGHSGLVAALKPAAFRLTQKIFEALIHDLSRNQAQI